MSILRIIFLTLILSGCAGNHRCDPRLDTDFFSTIGCSANGGYDSAVNQAKTEVTAAQQDKTRLLKQLKTLQAEQTQLEQSIRENDGALLASETELAEIERKLAHSKAAGIPLKGEIARTQKAIKAKEQEIAQLKDVNEEQKRKLAETKKRAEDLQRDLGLSLLYPSLIKTKILLNLKADRVII